MYGYQLSEITDVYSVGVLLLEIVRWKRNTDLIMPKDEVFVPMPIRVNLLPFKFSHVIYSKLCTL